MGTSLIKINDSFSFFDIFNISDNFLNSYNSSIFSISDSDIDRILIEAICNIAKIPGTQLLVKLQIDFNPST